MSISRDDVQSKSCALTPGRLAHGLESAPVCPQELERLRMSVRTVVVCCPSEECQTLDYLDLDPVQGHNVPSGRPIILQPGFGATSLSFLPNFRILCQHGRRVLSPYNYHGIPTRPAPPFPQAHVGKGAAIRATLDAASVSEVDGVGHSAGVIAMTIAARIDEHKKRFRNLVLMAPPLVENSWLSLTIRWVLEKIINDRMEQIRRAFAGDAVYGRRRNCNRNELKKYKQDFRRCFAEIVGVRNTDLRPVLKELRQSQGVQIALVFMRGDHLMPYRKMKKYADEAGIPRKHIHMACGTHSAYYENPAHVTKIILTAIHELDQDRIQ